jgi:Zincin-like metallopeptidase
MLLRKPWTPSRKNFVAVSRMLPFWLRIIRRSSHDPSRVSKGNLLLGIFHGVPATKRSVFNLPTGPEHIVLYQKNIDQSVQAKPKCVIKFARLSYMNWGTVLG